jgi:hypothetical protein
MGKSKDKGAVGSSKKNPKEELLAAAGGAAEGDKKGACACASASDGWGGMGWDGGGADWQAPDRGWGRGGS